MLPNVDIASGLPSTTSYQVGSRVEKIDLPPIRETPFHRAGFTKNESYEQIYKIYKSHPWFSSSVMNIGFSPTRPMDMTIRPEASHLVGLSC